jgi:hypothetical protein
MGHPASVSTGRPPSALDVEDLGHRVDQRGRPKRLGQEARCARVATRPGEAGPEAGFVLAIDGTGGWQARPFKRRLLDLRGCRKGCRRRYRSRCRSKRRQHQTEDANSGIVFDDIGAALGDNPERDEIGSVFKWVLR